MSIIAYDAGKEDGKKEKHEEILNFLEAKADQAMRAGQGRAMPDRMQYLAVEVSIREVIRDIKEKSK